MEISSDKFIFNDKRGKLISLSNKYLKIKIKRVFIITSSKKSIVRGEHAHKKCRQILCLIGGKANLEITNKYKKKRKIIFDKIGMMFDIKPRNWVKIKMLKKNTIILVLCDREYERSDYIFNKNEL